MLQRSQQYLENTPCAPVATASNKEGYILGCSTVKMGLVWECMAPLLGGKAVPLADLLLLASTTGTNYIKFQECDQLP